MLRGSVPDKNIKQIHDNYVYSLINYFKMIDKKDILQEEYNNLVTESTNIDKNYDIKKADSLLMEEKIPTLDNFVKLDPNYKGDRWTNINLIDAKLSDNGEE